MTQLRWPLDPLVDRLRQKDPQLSDGEIARRLRVSWRVYVVYRERGVPDLAADCLAVRAGMHPSTVWPGYVEAAPYVQTVRCRGCGATVAVTVGAGPPRSCGACRAPRRMCCAA